MLRLEHFSPDYNSTDKFLRASELKSDEPAWLLICVESKPGYARWRTDVALCRAYPGVW